MTVITEFEVAASSFGLAETMRELPDVVVDCERMVPSESAQLPYVWVTGTQGDEFGAAAAADPDVASVELVETFPRNYLYRVEWTQQDGSLREAIRDGTSVVLEASGRNGTWALKIRFDSVDGLIAFQEYGRRHGIELDVSRVRDLTAPKVGQYGLTARQREALLMALEMGYFRVPRETTLADVADALDVSPAAASERLRRAHANVLENTVGVGRSARFGSDHRKDW